MSSTNKTTYYNLSQFNNTDKPSWLNDYNNDMTIIDTNIKNNSNNIGNLTSLTTTAKTSLVNAINEVNQNSGVALIGDLSNLTTTTKTNVVSAINEVDYNTDTNTTAIGDLTSLTTTDKTSLVSAINEVASSGGGVQIIDLTNNSSSNPLILGDLEIGEYLLYFPNSSIFPATKTIEVKYLSTHPSSESLTITSGATLKIVKKMADMTSNYDYMAYITEIYCVNNGKYKMVMYNIGKTNGGYINISNVGNSYIPTTSADASANKMLRTDGSSGIYWGDFSSIGSNYNSSAIQYLKNVNGTINWITESNITPSMMYLGKINAYNSSANALDLSSYPAGTRIVLKNNDASRSFYIKVGSNVAEIPATSANDVSVINNTFYLDINSISGSDAGISIIWASTYEWSPIVTNTISVTFTSGGATVGSVTRNMQGYTLFQLEEDSSGNLSTTTLQQFVSIRTATFSKQRASQRPALHYFDKDKNSCILSFTSLTSGSQQVYEGIMTTKTASANGLYETYKVRFELNYSGTTYSSHTLTKTKIGIVFDETAINGYSATGTKTLSLNNGALEWV